MPSSCSAFSQTIYCKWMNSEKAEVDAFTFLVFLFSLVCVLTPLHFKTLFGRVSYFTSAFRLKFGSAISKSSSPAPYLRRNSRCSFFPSSTALLPLFFRRTGHYWLMTKYVDFFCLTVTTTQSFLGAGAILWPQNH